MHRARTRARARVHTHRLVFARASLVPFVSLPQHRQPPGDLAGNQTRGSHGVHSRTKDSHPQRHSTTSFHVAGLPSNARPTSHQTNASRLTTPQSPLPDAMAPSARRGWTMANDRFELGTSRFGFSEGGERAEERRKSEHLRSLSTWRVEFDDRVSYAWKKFAIGLVG